MTLLTGWLLDVYPNETDLTIWLICQDGRRLRLVQDFAPTLYAAGPPERLRLLWKWLLHQDIPVRLSRCERTDVFQGKLPVLAIEVLRPARLEALFREMSSAFPDLTWYDADISLPLRHAAAFDVFPLAHVQVEVQGERILRLTPLDTPWEIEPACANLPWGPVQGAGGIGEPTPLRVLSLEPDCNPAHAEPKSILISYDRIRYSLSLARPTALLASLSADLRRYDPDVILTAWGDTWLLPLLMSPPFSSPPFSEKMGGTEGGLPLNRDPSQPVVQRKEHTYFSYGQIVYRGAMVLLRGRIHLDQHNAMLWHDYGLPGVLEMARVTRQSIQEAARLSPGTGISSMQFVTALQSGILIPWHKHQHETPKTALDLLRADMGGMIYQPSVGLHRDVGGIDFVSMYPGIMVRFNISPEVPRQGHEIPRQGHEIPRQGHEIPRQGHEIPRQGYAMLRQGYALLPAENAPSIGAGKAQEFYEGSDPSQGFGLDLVPAPGAPGIVPRTLAPLLEKRLRLKAALVRLARYDCRRPLYTALASAHKWLLVTCFGYLGYKNARFGRIEAHEAVTAYGREALLRAKEAAEDLDFEILHMYVDGLWVHKPGCRTPADFEFLLADITERTGLPISLDGIYRWVVFLPSRVNAKVPVPNCYFGVFQDGSIKVRGIEARRRDTAPFIAETQMHLLEILAEAPDAEALPEVLPRAHAYLSRQFRALREGRVPLDQLLVAQKLSRELTDYSSPSPAARAVRQLQSEGRAIRPGQRVRFLFTRGKPGVRAWDLDSPPDPRTVDLSRYRTLLERAAQVVLQPVEGK